MTMGVVPVFTLVTVICLGSGGGGGESASTLHAGSTAHGGSTQRRSARWDFASAASTRHAGARRCARRAARVCEQYSSERTRPQGGGTRGNAQMCKARERAHLHDAAAPCSQLRQGAVGGSAGGRGHLGGGWDHEREECDHAGETPGARCRRRCRRGRGACTAARHCRRGARGLRARGEAEGGFSAAALRTKYCAASPTNAPRAPRVLRNAPCVPVSFTRAAAASWEAARQPARERSHRRSSCAFAAHASGAVLRRTASGAAFRRVQRLPRADAARSGGCAARSTRGGHTRRRA
jgi:hypothetical protein